MLDEKWGQLFQWMVVIHFVVTIAYPLLASKGGDSVYYYYLAKNTDEWLLQGQSGKFIVFLTYPLVHFCLLSYIGCMYVFSFIALFGWFFLLKTIYSVVNGAWFKCFYLLLLPQLHYWTCALGKDSLIFWGICMVVYAWYFHKSLIYYCLPCIVIGYIRSPVLMLLIVAFAVSFLIKSRVSVFIKVIFCAGMLVGGIAFMPMVEERLGGTDISSINSLQTYIESQEAYNQIGGGAVDMQGANIFVKIFSYLFRPLFFDARNVLQLEASFENIAWLFMFVFIIKHFRLKYLFWFPTLAFLLMWVAQGSVLNNLGIAMRQKIMFFPMFYLLFIKIFYENNVNEKYGIYQRKK